jgi:hypothetical protein
MESPRLLPVTPDHPHFEGLRQAEVELRDGSIAAAGGNSGRARVCARRAVGAFLQAIAGTLVGDVGTNAMANLRYVQSADLPEIQRETAIRLAGGARSALSGGPVSEDPLADAAAIINYFVRQASADTAG